MEEEIGNKRRERLYLLLLLYTIFVATMLVPQAMAAEFHVTDATEFKNALDTADSNGEDDFIYLAAGTYQGRFVCYDADFKSLTITNEMGTHAANIILDGQNKGCVLKFHHWADGPVAELSINGITVENGNNYDVGGGICAALPAYNISITNCIIRNNEAIGCGGGIYMDTHENLILENNLILNNTVTESDNNKSMGGGVTMIAPFGYYIIRNNIIARNNAQGISDPQGGGLWVGWLRDSVIHLTGNTIYDNEANKGGGVYFSYAYTANVYNNIIYGNTATYGGDIYFGSFTNRIGYNNDYSDIYGTWTESGGNLDIDPMFEDPINNDFHLQLTSQLIDNGTSAVPAPPGLPKTDFEGDPRISGAAPDIGADEYSTEEEPFTEVPVGVTSNITLADSEDIAAYLPPEYDGMDISDAVVLNVDVTDDTPGNSADDAYTDITISVGEMDIATCKVFKSDTGFLPEVADVTALPTVDGDPAFSRDLVNNTGTIRLYVGDPLLGVIPAAGFELEFAEGYNMISIPLNDSSVITASDLAAKIGTSCTEVVRWEGASQAYVSHIPGLPLNNFATAVGAGYFVNVNNPTSMTFEGPGWASPCVVALVSGYNMIGVPVNDSSVTTASTLATKIGTGCTEIVRWDSNTQSYISHIPGLPLNDFAITGGQGYFVNVNIYSFLVLW